MAETPARKKSSSTKAAPKKTKAVSSRAEGGEAARSRGTTRGEGLGPANPGVTLASLRENAGARPKRTRVGRGHGSGMVKTGGEGGKGQTVRSGGGKGPAFEGGQTPWARRLPHARGYSQKGRDTGHFGTQYAVVNISALAKWDPAVEVSPQTLREKRVVVKTHDGIKILGGNKAGASLPSGLRFRDVVFSATAREALVAAGANLGDSEG
jgi:large subunit ribosomal protein L15